MGDPAEGQLSVALGYRASGNASCPVPVTISGKLDMSQLSPADVDESLAVKKPDEPWRNNRLLR